MEALGAAATIIQLVSFTGEVLLKGYSFLSRVRKAPSEIRALLREVANFNGLLDQLESLAVESSTNPENAGKENVQNALQTLESLGVFEDCSKMMQVVQRTVRLCEQIEGDSLRNLGKKVLWPFKEKETKDMMAQLGRLREALSAAVVVDSARSLRELGGLVKSIDADLIETLAAITELQLMTQNTAKDILYVKDIFEGKMEEEERVSIRKWLHPDGINAEASFATALAMRQSKTGRWLLDSEDFVSWTKGVNECMWIYGIAGCGKTVISATIVKSLQQTSGPGDNCVLYFFCDHRNPTMQSFQDLLHAIVKQLLDQNPACFEDAKYWWEERLRTVAGPQTNAAKPLSTSEYIKFISQLCLRWDSVSLVVDALDECAGLDLFAVGLKDILEGPNVRLLLTSRHDVNLKRALEPVANYQISMMENMGEDIETYLVTEVQQRISYGTLKFKQKELEAVIVSAIVEKANGMILIAKLQLDYVCGLRSDRAVKEALAKLPSGIYATYDEILRQLCSKTPDDIEDMKRILQWLACSMEPLTVEQLAEIVSIRPDDRSLDESGIATDPLDLAACCGSLVTIHTQPSRSGQYEDLRGPEITLVTLAHASVEEYLKSGEIARDLSSKFHIDESFAHRQLAKTCLQYVGFEDFKNVTEPPEKHDEMTETPANSLQRLRRHLRNRTAKYAFFDYACQHWAAHLRRSESSDPYDDETIDLLNWFIHSDDYHGNYASWQQMYHHDVLWYCHNRPSLFYAIDFKIDRLVQQLLPSDADIDTMPPSSTCGNWPQTALHVAARCGALNIVQNLVRRGASVELKSGLAARAMTALHFAAEGGHADVVKFLLESGASPHSRSGSQSTPFYRAARSGSLKALRVLYDVGSDINALTWDKFTPLFEAVAHGRSRTASQLLDWGADPTVVNGMGQSTLKILQRSRNIEAQKTGKPLVTEDDILSDLKRIQESGAGFANYLKNLKPQYVLAMSIEMDTRPGPEREKDYRSSRDPSKIVTMSEFRDRDD